MIQLVAFLGNPGKEYEHNRHNAGWLLAEKLPFFNMLSWQQKFKGRYASLSAAQLQPFLPENQEDALLSERVHFIMPETYMNLSGDSIREVANFFKIEPASLLVVHDEIELQPGTISLKFSGGLGGHNGLRSIKSNLGTADFWRLRIGIGRPDHPDIAAWVLSDFSPQEEEVLNTVLPESAMLLLKTLSMEPQNLLPEWNKKKIA